MKGDVQMKKPTNDLLKEALKLEEIIRDASEKLAKIKEAARMFGPFSTKDFLVDVNEVTRQSLAGMKEVTKFYSFEELAKHELIKTVTYKTVRIVPKSVA